MKYIGLFVILTSNLIFGRLEINPLKHEVQKVSSMNFDAEIEKHRDWIVATVLFFIPKDRETSTFFHDVYNPLAKELKNVIRFGAIDCEAEQNFCDQNSIDQYPTVKVYPQHPAPDFTYTGDLTKEGLKANLLNQLSSENVKKVNSSNIASFLAKDPLLPKVLLFKEGSKVPPFYKALSNEFRKDMNFGLVDIKKDPSVHSRYKLNSFPKLVMQENQQTKPEVYKGKMKHGPIRDWANLKRQTFVSGGGYSDGLKSNNNNQPWLDKEIPELDKRSYKSICFDGAKDLCLIYLKEGHELTPNEENTLVSLKKKNQARRGNIPLRWMWLDVLQEESFKDYFAIDDGFPNVVILKPHQLRYTKAGEDYKNKNVMEKIKSLIENIVSGGGRFQALDPLPAFSDRKQTIGKQEL